MIHPSYYEDETQPPHKIRRVHMNAGPQLNTRLESLCSLIGEQGALCFDQAQHWLGFFSPARDRMKDADLLSTERTRKILRPWIDQGLLAYKVFYTGQRGWFWLTTKGLRYFSVPLRYYEPVPASLAHLYAVNTIRYIIAVRRPTDVWKSERFLRTEQNARTEGSKHAHLPDAEVSSTNETVKAIEVELTVKSEKRLEEIVFDLAANTRYNAIWYFAPPQVKSAVLASVQKLPKEHQKRFALYTLEGEPYKL